MRRIGAPLLFGRLWEETGCRAVVSEFVAGRGFGFEVERVIFVAVLHRLMVLGSDRFCVHWMADYAIPSADGLAFHRFYRAMAWLGEDGEAAGDGGLAPRCVKDLVEEVLFERRRDLFSELGLMDTTTSLSFEGAGGEALGAHGYSKDHRPDLKQMILAVVIDGEGRPVCTEILAGNTSESTVLLPIMDHLRCRFAIDADKLVEEARYDGIFVLSTNAHINPLHAVLRYRELLLVETLFRAANSYFPQRRLRLQCVVVVRSQGLAHRTQVGQLLAPYLSSVPKSKR